MQTQNTQTNWAGGAFMFLAILFVFGMFVGLPIVGWGLLLAAFAGLWVATSKQRAHERQTEHVDSNARPWRK